MPSRSAVFDAPVELVKIIFDTAARNEKSTAATLIQVCKASRDWATPILYENVQLSDNPSAKRFERMLETTSTHCPPVKTLHGACMPNNLDVLLSNRCQTLEAITLHNYDAHRLQQLALPSSLTHVTIAGSLRYVHFTRAMLVSLRNVTHLRFPNDVPTLPSAEEFREYKLLPKLTHFSCCYQPAKKSRHDELERCLGTLLRAPSLRLLVVYVHQGAGGQAARSIAESGGRLPLLSDPRVVFTYPADLPEETKSLSPTYDAVWRVGERIARTCR